MRPLKSDPLHPIIVISSVPPELRAELIRLAHEEDRTVSSQAKWLLKRALRAEAEEAA